jgi:hypothetical protein
MLRALVERPWPAGHQPLGTASDDRLRRRFEVVGFHQAGSSPRAAAHANSVIRHPSERPAIQ